MLWKYFFALAVFILMLAWAAYGRRKKDLMRLSTGQFFGGVAAATVAILTQQLVEDLGTAGAIGVLLTSLAFYVLAVYLLFMGARGLWRYHWNGETLHPRHHRH